MTEANRTPKAEHLYPNDGFPHRMIDCECNPLLEERKLPGVTIYKIHHHTKYVKKE